MIVVPVIAVTTVSVLVLVNVLHPEDKDQLEVVKTGLAVGAGTGGVVALVLNGRRQWSNDHDAAARRITELYSKSVDQLGSDKAAVRLGGLYALERLANSNPTQELTIGNVICAYLRMPYTPSRELPDDATQEQRDRHDQLIQEREIRQAALDILTRHNRHNSDEYWPALDISIQRANLSDADLFRADLTDANLFSADLTGADLTYACLAGAYLSEVNLTGADLTDADLTNANLTNANLTNANLANANLANADLTGTYRSPTA